jgi:hypothetical protein
MDGKWQTGLELFNLPKAFWGPRLEHVCIANTSSTLTKDFGTNLQPVKFLISHGLGYDGLPRLQHVVITDHQRHFRRIHNLDLFLTGSLCHLCHLCIF